MPTVSSTFWKPLNLSFLIMVSHISRFIACLANYSELVTGSYLRCCEYCPSLKSSTSVYSQTPAPFHHAFGSPDAAPSIDILVACNVIWRKTSITKSRNVNYGADMFTRINLLVRSGRVRGAAPPASICECFYASRCVWSTRHACGAGRGILILSRGAGVEPPPPPPAPPSAGSRIARAAPRRPRTPECHLSPVTEITHPHPAIKPTSKSTDTHYRRALSTRDECLQPTPRTRLREWGPKCNDVV